MKPILRRSLDGRSHRHRRQLSGPHSTRMDPSLGHCAVCAAVRRKDERQVGILFCVSFMQALKLFSWTSGTGNTFITAVPPM